MFSILQTMVWKTIDDNVTVNIVTVNVTVKNSFHIVVDKTVMFLSSLLKNANHWK